MYFSKETFANANPIDCMSFMNSILSFDKATKDSTLFVHNYSFWLDVANPLMCFVKIEFQILGKDERGEETDPYYAEWINHRAINFSCANIGIVAAQTDTYYLVDTLDNMCIMEGSERKLPANVAKSLNDSFVKTKHRYRWLKCSE